MIVEQVFPLFESGRIIKRDALLYLRDGITDLLSIVSANYGNGIISGFEITGEDKKIKVHPGVLKDGDFYFTLKSPIELPCEAYNETVQIMIRKANREIQADFICTSYEILIEPVRILKNQEYELGRFRLEQGANLRGYQSYQSFRDLSTEFNTLNLLHVRYACEGGYTLVPFVVKLFAKEILASQFLQPVDLSFALLCINSKVITGETLNQYLMLHTKPQKEYSEPFLWYQQLLLIYSKLVLGNSKIQTMQKTERKTVIE